MAIGPGKYDDVCTELRERFKADGCMVLIVNGTRGTGQSMQLTPKQMLAFCMAMGLMADGMAADLQKLIEGELSAMGADSNAHRH